MTRVLIVDDKEESAYYLEVLLKGQGFVTDTARHGAEALVKARQCVPDLVVTDLLMPVMDGYTLLRLARSDDLLRNVPFIVYTATYTDPEDERLALNLGADAFVLKPAQPEDFLARIREVRSNLASGRLPSAKTGKTDDRELLKVYSETLIRKLEEKSLQLEESNRALRQDIAERRKTELEREQYYKFFQIANDLMIFTDARGCITRVNQSCLNTLGYSEEEMLGQAYLSLVHPEDKALTGEELLHRVRSGAPVQWVNRLLCKDGSIRWFSWRANYGPSDQMTYAIASDITDRIQSDELLRLLKSAVVQAQEAVLITDAQINLPGPKVVFVNPAFSRMTGYEPAEIIGCTPRKLQCPGTDRAVLDRLRMNLERGEPFKGQAVNRRKNGEEFILEWQITPLRNEKGIVTHFVAIQRDVTEAKRAEEELKWKSAFLEALVDATADGILVVDSLGRKILQNQRFIKLWKMPPAIAGQGDDQEWMNFVSARTRNPRRFTEQSQALNSQPDKISREELELLDGTYLDLYSSPVRDKSGRHYGRIWAFHDITLHRELEAQLRQSQKMEALGQLAGGVAHDFNNILAVIQLQAGLLRSEASLTLEQLEFAAEIESAASRASNLTRQLLLFSRQQAMQPRTLDLNEVVENIARMLRRTLGEKISLEFSFKEKDLFIEADPIMLDQILLNLTVNARDAMPNGGIITIETSSLDLGEKDCHGRPGARPGSFVCLTVSDTGSGIAPQHLPRIFEPFFTTKEIGKGTGLGLATVFGIVQQHKGWIEVRSELRKGSCFRIFFPRQGRPAQDGARWISLETPKGSQETILLVEDENAVRKSIHIILTRLGYRILDAENALDALEVWKNHQQEIKMMITDLVMPGPLNGRDLARQLLAERPSLRVVYLSGYSADIAGMDIKLEMGVNFLTKPFDSNMLALMVRQALKP